MIPLLLAGCGFFGPGDPQVEAWRGGAGYWPENSRTALEGVDPTVPRAARTLGARRPRAFFTVTLPLAAPGIFAGMMLAFAKALGDYGAVLMLAGDIKGETQTASMAIMDLWFGRKGGEAAGMVAVLTAIGLTIRYTVNKISRRRRRGR